MRLILFVLIMLELGWAARAEAQVRQLSPCDCIECLAFRERRSEAARQLYSLGLEEMLRLAGSGAVYRADDVAGTSLDPAAVIAAQRTVVLPVREAIGGALVALDPLAPQCKAGDPNADFFRNFWASFIHVDMATCSIPAIERRTVRDNVPCPEMYLGVLAHELSHVADCLALETRRRFTPEELFRSEIKAAQAEEDVLAVLRHQRMEECREQSLPLTTPLHTDWSSALRFLQEARQYDQLFPPDTASRDAG